MRFLLAIMAMTLFAVSIGCDTPTATESTAPTTEEGSDKAAEGSDKAAEGSDKAEEGSDKAGASTEANNDTQTVSLKLPGMTWGGCVASVKSALEGVDGVTGIELDGSKTWGKFTAPASLDVEATLNKLVEGGNKHLKGWSAE